MSEFNNLKLDVENEIAVLTISRPAALNALNSETLDELNTALTEIEARDDIKVVILTGGPDKKGNEFKSFVAGADISEMVNFTAAEAYRIGLVNKVVAPEELMNTAKAMAKKIISKGSYAVSVAKAAINNGYDMDIKNAVEMEANLFGVTCSTHDKTEGMTAFLERRAADLTDF